jgi:hypothetical protein
LKVSGQIYTDIKQLTDAGLVVSPQSLLAFGIGNCELDLIKSAINKGTDINKQDQESLIASQIMDYGSAVFSGRSVSDLRRDYLEIIRFLLQSGAKPNVSSDYSYNAIPLLNSAQYRDIEVVKLLLDFKADPNARDNSGLTSLHVLGMSPGLSFPFKNSTEIAKLLISKGAKMTRTSIDEGESGDTPLEVSKQTLEIIQSDASYKTFPWYDELANSLKNLIGLYSKY